MTNRNCEVDDYRAAQMQSLSSADGVPVSISSFRAGTECPVECQGMIEKVGEGMFPKSTLECPTYGTEVQLGRFATLLRQTPNQ